MPNGWRPGSGYGHPSSVSPGYTDVPPGYYEGYPNRPPKPGTGQTGGAGGGGGGGGYQPPWELPWEWARDAWFQQQAQQGGGGGPGKLPGWRGQMGQQSWLGMGNVLPWTAWQQTPWANAPEGRSQEAMAWLNTWLPWYQQALAERQFGQQLELTRELEGQRAGLQRELANVEAFGRRWRPNTRWL